MADTVNSGMRNTGICCSSRWVKQEEMSFFCIQCCHHSRLRGVDLLESLHTLIGCVYATCASVAVGKSHMGEAG